MEIPTDLITKGSDWLTNLSSQIISKVSEYGINPPTIVSQLLIFFLGALLIWVGSKVSEKIAKVIMIILGVIIIGLIFVSWIGHG